MPENNPYRPYLSASAAEFIFLLPRRQQRRLLVQIALLGKRPFLPADYRTLDEDGRETSHLNHLGTVISYSIDHAEKRVMILELRSID